MTSISVARRLSNQQMELSKARYLRRPSRLIFSWVGRAAAVAQRLRSSFAVR
jgi:hypothetical protein